MKYFLLFLFIKNIIENNSINLHQLKKINNLNFRKTEDNNIIHSKNQNIIYITIFSKYTEKKYIHFIINFCSYNVLIYKNGIECANTNYVEMNKGESYNITLHYPNDFSGSCESMFHGAKDIIEIKFKNFKGCNSAKLMFYNCNSLKNLDLSSFDTSKISDMSHMFSNCKSLEVLNVTSFNTNNVKFLKETFRDCSKLKFLNLSSFDTSLVEDMDGIFKGSLNLNSLILSDKFTMKSLKKYDYLDGINECMIIIENGAKIRDDLKNNFKKCQNVIEIELSIELEEEEEIEFIWSFSAKFDYKEDNTYHFYDHENFINVDDIKIFVNSERQSLIKKINAKKDENYTIKIKFPSNFNSYCDGMFINLKKIKSIKFYNFKGCKSTDKMFDYCSSLKYVSNICLSPSSNLIGVSHYEINENNNNIEKFCNCNSNYLSCKKEESTFYESEINNLNQISYYINKCKNSKYEYIIYNDKKCLGSCENTKYPFTILHNETCVKLCPKDLYLFNSYCYIKCPNETHKVEEDEKRCECNNLFFIDEKKNKTCLKKYCNESDGYYYLIKNKNQCVKNCSKDEYYKFSFNKNCYFKCPKNTKNFKENKCECLYKFYNKSDELICLNEDENCDEKYNLTLENSKECLKNCPENYFKFNNKCLSKCENEKIEKEKECVCKYNFFNNNSFLNCLNENENCPSNFPYLNTENNECLIQCPKNLLIFNKKCVKTCPEKHYEFNSTCVLNCPLKYYYKTKEKKCEISDCLERDFENNFFYIHENNYEEFLGKNTCNNNNNNFKYFVAEIYASNFVFDSKDNSKSKLNTSECEKILKKNYHISDEEILTIFKIDYHYENLLTPKMRYDIYYKSQKLNITLCENVSLEISSPVDFENAKIDMNKLNSTLEMGIDIFNLSSEFFNDICSTFSSENGTDVPIKDRKNDYYQNVSLCQEGCVYNGFDKENNKINCNCNKKENVNNKTENKNNENKFFKLISNSNLKVLKCFYLNKSFKTLAKNIGNYVFLVCELGEIFLVLNVLFKGFFPLMKNLKNIQKNLYYKNIKNPPKKKINYNIKEKTFKNTSFQNSNESSTERNFSNSHTKNNIIIYKGIGICEENVKTKEKKIFSQKKYTNEEINDLNYNESILVDHRSFFLMFYSFLQYSQLIIFTFVTKTDFNLQSIKISLFLFSFAIYLTFNTLFFTDETMSHIYKKGGSFDFIYNLPKTLFSSLCCSVINFLLKFLSLSQNDIKMLNCVKKEKDKLIKLGKLLKCWKIKIIIFYFLIFVFFGLFHVYVVTFCAVYVNTQKHLIKNTLISFSLSMVYPFGICLFTAILRKLSLKFKNKFLFGCSKIMQLF